MRMPPWKRDWWTAQPEQQTCRDCGKTGPKHYVQPQPPARRCELATHIPYALCTDCIAAINRRLRAAHRNRLDAMPRCEAPGCDARSTWHVAGVRLCGRHRTAAQTAYERAAARHPLALVIGLEYDRSDVLRWATGEKSEAEKVGAL